MGTIFRGGKIIVGIGDSIENGVVAIDNGLITFVGTTKRYKPLKGDSVFDISGKTILPGLIDCHVHLCLDGSPDPISTMIKEPIPKTTLKFVHHARLTLEAGVTTVRDLGGRDYIDIAIRDGIESKFVPGPRIICSGKLICMTGGHGWQFGVEANGADSVRKAVREQVKAGANVIKLMATGGTMTENADPASTQFTLEELRAGVEEARKAGKRTASHAQGNEGIKNALHAGIDSIEHGIFLNDEVIELMLEKKAYLIPTLSAPYNILKGGIKAGVPAFVVEKVKSVKEVHLKSAKNAYKRQVSIAMGTDAGTPFNLHGENLRELELLTKDGLTPLEAITTATRTASEVLGLDKAIGTLERGKLADLIVVNGDPFENIGLLQKKDNIVAIMKDGLFYKCNL